MSTSQPATTQSDRVERVAYSMREAAAAIGVCERSIWQAIHDGRLRASRIGRSVRISRVDLMQFLNDTAGSPTEGEVSA